MCVSLMLEGGSRCKPYTSGTTMGRKFAVIRYGKSWKTGFDTVDMVW